MGICSGVCQQQAKNIVNESAIITETIKQALQEDIITNKEIYQEERQLHMETGAIYEGDLINGIRSGKGRQVWPDGDFVNDMADGKGLLVNAEGSVYDGEWLEDKASGFGKYQSHDGLYYEGQWLEDKQHGIGKEINSKNECYEGEFFRGVKQGTGKLTINDGEFYEGEFQNGMMHGKAKELILGKQQILHWRLERGKIDGFGIMKWDDGRYYEGNFQMENNMEKVHLFGREKYIGAWINGYQEGEGTYYNKKVKVEQESGRMEREQNGLTIIVAVIAQNKHFEQILIFKNYIISTIIIQSCYYKAVDCLIF